LDIPLIEKEIVMKQTCSNRTLARKAVTSAVSLALGALFIGASMSAAAAPPEELKFDMAVADAAKACLSEAKAHVTVRDTSGGNQRMDVHVEGLPPDTEFSVFVLQVPTGPFGMSWYQGDIVTDKKGRGNEEFRGIFSSELFVFAPAVRDAPQTDRFDALTNPATPPVHTYHLGLWFSNTADAEAAGCPGTPTPFEGNHQAGIQVFNTSNFGKEAATGPLSQF
jgi:hypothetical protein